MASSVLEYLIRAKWQGAGEVREAKTDLDSLGQSGTKSAGGLNQAATATGGLKSAVGGLLAGGALVGAGYALARFGSEAIQAASDAEEAGAKFETVFGEFAAQSEEDLERIADATNRSKYELIEYASTIQDTLVPLGFLRGEAADVSEEVTQLAIDLGSFNNLETADVIRDIQSALVGNTETLRKYGVVASQAAIEQEAINSGLWDGAGAIDAQAKAQAILQLAIAGTTDAQGDAVRTSDSYANTVRGLEAATLDLKVAFGQVLLPVATQVVTVLTDIVDAVNEVVTLPDQIRGGREDVLQFAEGIARTTQNYDQFVGALEAGGVEIEDLEDALVNTFDAERNYINTTTDEFFHMFRRSQDLVDITEELNEKRRRSLIIEQNMVEVERERRQGRFDEEMADKARQRGIVAENAVRVEIAAWEDLIQEYDDAVTALGNIAEAQEAMRQAVAFQGDLFMESWRQLTEPGGFDVEEYLIGAADAAGQGAPFLADYAEELGLISEETGDAAEDLAMFKFQVEAANEAFRSGATSALEWKTAVGIARLEWERGATAGIAGEDELGRQAQYWDEIDANTQKWNETLGLVDDPLANAITRVEDLQARIDTLTGGTWEVPIEADPNGAAQTKLEEIKGLLDDIRSGANITIGVEEGGSTAGGSTGGGTTGGGTTGGGEADNISTVPLVPPPTTGGGTGTTGGTGSGVSITQYFNDRTAAAIGMAVARQMAGVG